MQLSDWFSALNKNIHMLSEKFGGQPYTLTIIVATKIIPELVVKGPTRLRKRNVFEFVLWIPYVEFKDVQPQREYVLGQIKAGIIYIFQKYHEETTGIDEFFADFLLDTVTNPDKYK